MAGAGEGNLKRALFLTGLLCLLSAFIQAQAAAVTPDSPVAVPGNIEDTVLGETPVSADGTTKPSPQAVGAGDFLQMILVLILVVAAMYGIFFFVRHNRKEKAAEDELIKVLGSRMLSNNRHVHIVEIGKHVYFLGSADGGVNLLAELTDSESVDEIRLEASALKSTGTKNFADLLGGILGGGKGDPFSALRLKQQRFKKPGGPK